MTPDMQNKMKIASKEPDSPDNPDNPDNQNVYHHLNIDRLMTLDVEMMKAWGRSGWSADFSCLEEKIEQALRTCMTVLKMQKKIQNESIYELSLVLVDDAHISTLNAVWRNKDKPTNVLSFSAIEDVFSAIEDADKAELGQSVNSPSINLSPTDRPAMLGDIVMAHETIEREAEAQGKTPLNHFLHLFVHGFLHLCGYDHAVPDAAKEMATLEIKILANMNIASPYEGAQVVGKKCHE